MWQAEFLVAQHARDVLLAVASFSCKRNGSGHDSASDPWSVLELKGPVPLLHLALRAGRSWVQRAISKALKLPRNLAGRLTEYITRVQPAWQILGGPPRAT